MNRLRVSEHFYSIQGEGPTVGVPAIFVRLQGCNLNCGQGRGDWVCDTIDVWKNGTAHAINDWHDYFLKEYQQPLSLGAHIIITGGEPLLQQAALIDWLSTFKNQPFIEVETNGTIIPQLELSRFINQWNVSPKLSNSGELMSRRSNHDALQWFLANDCSIFKFVISSDKDIDEIKTLCSIIHTWPMRRKYLMPAADSKIKLETIYPSIIEMCKTHGFSLSQRFHLSIWDQTTGV